MNFFVVSSLLLLFISVRYNFAQNQEIQFNCPECSNAQGYYGCPEGYVNIDGICQWNPDVGAGIITRNYNCPEGYFSSDGVCRPSTDRKVQYSLSWFDYNCPEDQIFFGGKCRNRSDWPRKQDIKSTEPPTIAPPPASWGYYYYCPYGYVYIRGLCRKRAFF